MTKAVFSMMKSKLTTLSAKPALHFADLDGDGVMNRLLASVYGHNGRDREPTIFP